MVQATIADVAKVARVSLATVSRVMNGNTSVDPTLATRVRKAAEELQYSASPLARSLVLKRTQTIAVVIPDLGNPTFHEILRGISRAAGAESYHVLIADSAEDAEQEAVIATGARRRADGLILCAPRMSQDELEEVVQTSAPVVVVNREQPMQVSSVSVDYRTGLFEIAQHLYGLGHRSLLYLAGASASSSNDQRLAALEKFRTTHPDVRVRTVPCGVGFRDGADAVETVQHSDASAVLAFNDLVAIGLMNALQSRGVRIPEDLSITGFDDIPFAAFATPSLTTAAVPAAALGEQAWLSMTRLLSSNMSSPSASYRPTLIVRESTARPG